MKAYIPIYKVMVEDQFQFCAYLNAKFVNIDYPTRRKLFNWVNRILVTEMVDNDYSINALKLMYPHYSDGQFYVWNTDTQVSFEPKVPKHWAEMMIASESHFNIPIEVSPELPDIFWEAS